VRNRFKLHTHQLAAAAFTRLPRCSTAGESQASHPDKERRPGSDGRLLAHVRDYSGYHP
jgi:hypothetical protein